MNSNLLVIGIVISVPVSIISSITAFKASYTVNKLSEIVARQHDINPAKLKKNSEKLPYVRRLINIKNVEYSADGNARIYFTDSVIDRTIFSQIGCPAFGKSIGKKYNVDYNTVSNSYAIDCSKTSAILK